jgi:hypothetical protein
MGSSKLKDKSEKVKGFGGLLAALISPFRGWGLGLILGFGLLIPGPSCQAQTFAEWFEQGKTQIKYLGLQIAALSSAEQALKQGYAICKSGLTSITSFTGTEYGLHQDYYASLKAVSPAVKSDPDIAAIGVYQQEILAAFQAFPALTLLTAGEAANVASVRQALMTNCDRDLSELALVVTPGQLSLTDDERIKKLHQICLSMRDKDVFARDFCAKIALLLAQRQLDNEGLETLNRLYGMD